MEPKIAGFIEALTKLYPESENRYSPDELPKQLTHDPDFQKLFIEFFGPNPTFWTFEIVLTPTAQTCPACEGSGASYTKKGEPIGECWGCCGSRVRETHRVWSINPTQASYYASSGWLAFSEGCGESQKSILASLSNRPGCYLTKEEADNWGRKTLQVHLLVKTLKSLTKIYEGEKEDLLKEFDQHNDFDFQLTAYKKSLTKTD